MIRTRKTEGGFIPILVAIVIVAALAIGGGYYASHKKAAPAPAPEATTTVDTQVEATTSAAVPAEIGASGSGTLRALIGAGKDLMCTLNSTGAEGNTSGTMYISGTTMRGDFTVKGPANSPAAGAINESHMVRNGDSVYVWSGSQGAKMAMMATTNQPSPVPNSSNMDLDKKVDYKCSAWVKDSSKFAVPTTVKFMDVSAMMKAGVSGTPAMPTGTVNADIESRLKK